MATTILPKVVKAVETDDAVLLSIHKSVLEEWTFKIPLMQALMESELRFDDSACDVFEFAHTLYHLLERLYGSGDKLATHTAPTEIN